MRKLYAGRQERESGSEVPNLFNLWIPKAGEGYCVAED